MAVIIGIREPVEHLQTDKVQVTQPVAVATRFACNSVLCRIKHQAVAISFVLDMLNLQNNALQTLVLGYNIRSGRLDKSPINRRIHKSKIVNAVAPIQLENCIQKACRHPHVIRISKQHFKDRIVVNIDVFIFFAILHNALVDIASRLMYLANGAEHFCVLFPIHNVSFAE